MDAAYSPLLRFFTAMKTWNDKFYPLMKANSVEFAGAAVAELKPIFQQYVWPNAVRGDERLKISTTRHPSDYDPNSDIIEDIESGETRTIIYVQSQTGFQDRFRYTMVRRVGEWKVAKREVYDDVSEKWKTHHI